MYDRYRFTNVPFTSLQSTKAEITRRAIKAEGLCSLVRVLAAAEYLLIKSLSLCFSTVSNALHI